MAKYINADKIPYTRIRYEDDFDVEFSPKLAFKDDIDKMPAADVVEVVYCKDCKHRDKNHVCTGLGIFAERSVMVGDYFFCGAGERRETKNEL